MSGSAMEARAVVQAAEAIASAKALVIGAGAGMGVDSGLPDFRGPEGFWRAYPAYRALRLDFETLADPVWFDTDPALAWGFYGHRLGLYRTTRPHPGFALLAAWAARMPQGAFVFTSNVDGQFQRAGFGADRIVEIHGSIHRLQCLAGCGAGLFDAAGVEVRVDPNTFRAREPLPRCPRCGALARPNILMFGDGDWDPHHSEAQWARFRRWVAALEPGALAVVECGAGTAIPSVRNQCEALARALAGGTGALVRINPRESQVPPGRAVGLACGALEGLRAIAQRLEGR